MSLADQVRGRLRQTFSPIAPTASRSGEAWSGLAGLAILIGWFRFPSSSASGRLPSIVHHNETSNRAMERTPRAFGIAQLVLVRPRTNNDSSRDK
jgi:hypothetical protein